MEIPSSRSGGGERRTARNGSSTPTREIIRCKARWRASVRACRRRRGASRATAAGARRRGRCAAPRGRTCRGGVRRAAVAAHHGPRASWSLRRSCAEPNGSGGAAPRRRPKIGAAVRSRGTSAAALGPGAAAGARDRPAGRVGRSVRPARGACPPVAADRPPGRARASRPAAGSTGSRVREAALRQAARPASPAGGAAPRRHSARASGAREPPHQNVNYTRLTYQRKCLS